MSGWIKLHRSLQDSAIANHPEYLAVWVHLMLRAQHSSSEFVVGRQIVKLSAGQLVFGRIKFSAETGVSENKVRAALDVMKSLKMITIKSMAKFSIISITKWQDYQSESPANNHETASNSPALNQHPATYKNDKNDKNEENLKDITPSASQDKPAKKTTPKLDYSCWPSMPSDQVMADYLALRKTKRAGMSQTVINRLAKEFNMAAQHGVTVDQCLAECVTRGWQGFKFEWIQNSAGSRFAKNTNNTGENHESVTDAEFFGNLDPEITGRLFAEPASDISGLEGRSVGRSSSVDDGIQTPAAKRVC